MTSILITGGTGSFGQAFSRRLLSTPEVTRVAIYSRGEHLQETMAREITDERLRFFIGDVRDRDRLEMAMRGIDVVVHAAALKVVPIAEYNPTECIATNIYGAENVVKGALRTGVGRVIALSTDKAVNPINLYGASKLAAEKIFMAANNLAAGRCSFNVVRYGNVAFSSGSVMPFFQRLVDEGKSNLPVTDARMTRFHITMDQAIDLVLASFSIGEPSIVVPKIPSFRIVDLVEAFGKESSLVGIRPGEKLHESLMSEDEARYSFDFNNCFFIRRKIQTQLDTAAYRSDTNNRFLSVDELKKIIQGEMQ